MADEEVAVAPDPVRRLIHRVAIVCALLFAWYVTADRWTPHTDQARIDGYVVPIAPEVSGRVTEVLVGNNQIVEAGDLLLEIDPLQYELAVKAAEADLEEAGQTIGMGTGRDNTDVRSAMAALERARDELANTSLYAPSMGGITDLSITVGQYASAGQPLMTFISASDVWVVAHLRENSLGNIEPGDAAEILLDVAPGRIFQGTVASIGYGVETTHDPLAWLWIRFLGLLSFVY